MCNELEHCKQTSEEDIKYSYLQKCINRLEEQACHDKEELRELRKRTEEEKERQEEAEADSDYWQQKCFQILKEKSELEF